MSEPARGGRLAALAVAALVAVGVWLLTQSGAESTIAPPARAPESPPAPPAPSIRVRERPRRAAEASAADASDSSTTDAADPPERSLRVTVVSAADKRPIAGAFVRALGAGPRVEGTTGADGTVVFDATDLRFSSVVVRKRGFLVVESDLAENDAMEHRVELTVGTPVPGRVVEAYSHAPIAGARVAVDHKFDVQLVTDADGRFELAGVRSGLEFRVYAAKPGFRGAIVVVTRSGPGPEIEVVLGDGGVVEGTVYDQDGKAIPRTSVYLLPEDGEAPDPTELDDGGASYGPPSRSFLFPENVTDDAGRFEFKGAPVSPPDESQPVVPQARIVLARARSGRFAQSAPATFTRAGQRMQRDVHFVPPASLTVRVTNAEPLPQGTRIEVQRSGANRMVDAERDLAEGATAETFEGLRRGLYFVSVVAGSRIHGAGFQVMREVNVADGERAEVEFAIDGDRRIVGTVVDASGKPIGGLALRFETGERRSGSLEAWTRTDDDGSFAFEHLAPAAGTVELDEPMNEIRATLSDRSSHDSFVELRVRGVVPGGPELRLVVQRPGRITGRLVPAPATKDHLELAFVSDEDVSSESVQFAEEGRFTCQVAFVDRPIDIFCKRDDCAPVVFANRTLAPGATLDLGDVRFEPGLTFEGRLVGTDGKPLAGARVAPSDPWFERSLVTDADGKFRFDHLPRGAVHVLVQETQRTARWRLTIDPSLGSGEFTIGAGVPVTGRVLDQSGAPAAEMQLRLMPEAAGRLEHAGAAFPMTDADGRFTVRVQPGRFRVVPLDRRNGSVVEPSSFEAVADGPNPPLELRLR